ncbi:hypothetical protein [Albidovulum sp.]|uniref:hypothetical protein n=1 Tax=Albidovulum sp. TaxID=1872424 RepID=UPI003528293D
MPSDKIVGRLVRRARLVSVESLIARNADRLSDAKRRKPEASPADPVCAPAMKSLKADAVAAKPESIPAATTPSAFVNTLGCRSPDDDLPADFETQKDRYHRGLGLFRDAGAFVAQVRDDPTRELHLPIRVMSKHDQVRLGTDPPGRRDRHGDR